MADVYDRWHKSRPKPDEVVCAEHKSKIERLVPTKDHGKGKRWQARWRDAGGKQVKENFERKTDAEARADAVGADLRRGFYVDPALGREAFAAVAARWAESAPHRTSTADRVERAMRLHILPILGPRPIAAVQPSEIQSWIKDRSDVLAPSSLRVTYSYVVSVFRSAVFDRVIAANPCERVRLPENVEPEAEPLPVAVVEAMIEAISPRYQALLKFDAGSGLRQGECFGLEVGHVDFLRREVKVRQQLIYPDHGGAAYLGPPKTRLSNRTVPLAQSIVDALAAHLAAYPPQPVEIEDRTDPRKPVKRVVRLIFTNHHGRPVTRGSWSGVWHRAVVKANEELAAQVPACQVPDGASMHGLRHFYASVLIGAGESVKVVQRRLGHAKPSITLDTYAHLWPEAEDTSRAAVEAVFGQRSALKVPSSSNQTAKNQVRAVSYR